MISVVNRTRGKSLNSLNVSFLRMFRMDSYGRKLMHPDYLKIIYIKSSV